MNQDHSVVFEIAPKYSILDSLVGYEGNSITSKGFLPTVVDIMVIWIKFTHSHPFYFRSKMVPKMLMFTLAISCLTTSNLPWFMDLTFQVPMQYCSLQHWTLCSLSDTSITGILFHFGSATSFFLELLLHSILNTYQPSGLIFQWHIFLPFHTFNGVLKARILEWFAISYFSGPLFVRTLHHDRSGVALHN